MPVIPLDVDDEVLYTIRKVYLSRDTSVTIQTRLDFWGSVFFNGSPIANIGAIPIATQAQAEAGTDNTTVMSPLRTAQAITVQAKPAILAGNGGGTTNFLRADGLWVPPPGGGGVTDGDKGDITVLSSGTIWNIDAGAVSNGKLAAMAANTIKGNAVGSSQFPTDMSVATTKTLLGYTKSDVGLGNVSNTADASKPVFTTTVNGIVPNPGSATGKFLKDDATWGTPAGGGGTTEVWVGPNAPTGSETIWYDNDAVAGTTGITSTSISVIWTGNQAAYDAIVTKDPATMYVVS